MKKSIFILWVSLLTLMACTVNAGSSGTSENATLAPVPAEYAGLANPLGTNAVREGAKVFKANCEMCHGPQGYGDGPAGQSLDPRP